LYSLNKQANVQQEPACGAFLQEQSACKLVFAVSVNILAGAFVLFVML